MKVLRSSLMVAAAVITAACTKNSTNPPPVTTAIVHSVVVAPSTATLTVGQIIPMTAAVTADAGAVVTPITWTSSDNAKVSVSGTGTTGTVTANVATPGVAICAAVGGATGCATVTVSGAAVPVPATVSIQSITVGCTAATVPNCGLNVPVTATAVAGTIDVRVNVSPGNETVSKVVLLVGTTRADSQTFSAAQSAALRYAADQAVATQSAFPPILFSINTAKYNLTTGVPAWINGNNAISVQLYTTASGATARSTATYQTPLTFVNIDGSLATLVTSGTVANVNSSTGFRYDRGSLTATVLPVVYTGRAVTAATLFFGSNCDASGIGRRNIAMTAPATGSTAWTATLPAVIPTNGSAVNTVNNYEFYGGGDIPNCATLNTVGETIGVTGTDSNGDAIFSAANPPLNTTALNSLRLDNRPPQVGNPGLEQNPNNRGNGWVNATIAFLSRNSSTNPDGVPIRPAAIACPATGVFAGGAVLLRDCGEGSYTFNARIGPNTTGTLTDVRGLASTTTQTLPARSLIPTAYCVMVDAVDALGNEALVSSTTAAATNCTVPPAGPTALAAGVNHMLFGVDLDPPTVAFVDSTFDAPTQGLNANMRRNTAATIGNGTGQNFVVTVADTGLIGNSGMSSGSAVVGTVLLRNDASATPLTAQQKCIVGLIASDLVTCGAVSVNAAPGFPLVAVSPTAANSVGAAAPGATAITSQNVPGYYTYSAVARDAAGNSTAALSRVIAYNLTANVPSLTTALFNVPLSGSTAVFNANSSTNFDIWNSTYTMTYTGSGLFGPILYVPAVLNGFNGTQLFSNVSTGITLNNFMRQVELVTAINPVTVGAATKPTTLTGVVRDQANVPSAAVPTSISGASVTTGVSYLNAVTWPAPLLTRSWAVTNAAATLVSSGSSGPIANALSVVLTADAFGPTATYNPPFARVDFFAEVGANLEQIGSTTALSTIDDGSAFGRRHRYSFTWTPGATSPISGTAWVMGAQNIFAIGVNAAGDALVTLVNANVAITNP